MKRAPSERFPDFPKALSGPRPRSLWHTSRRSEGAGDSERRLRPEISSVAAVLHRAGECWRFDQSHFGTTKISPTTLADPAPVRLGRGPSSRRLLSGVPTMAGSPNRKKSRRQLGNRVRRAEAVTGALHPD